MGRGRGHVGSLAAQPNPRSGLLFRYSALTFNGHRIHYVRSYVTGGEGYPGLVVHGPLIAILLVDLVRRQLTAERIAGFSFTAVAPIFDGETVTLHGEPPDGDGRVRLWATAQGTRLAMRAEVQLG